MRNRAKCKLCGEIIESFHRGDYVACLCDEIAIAGGNEKLESFAKNWSNFLRVDDEGNEIVVNVYDKIDNDTDPLKETLVDDKGKRNRQDYINILDMFCKNINQLPPDAKYSFVSHAYLMAVLTIILAIFETDE